MQLLNVTDEVARGELEGVEQQSVISPVKQNAPDVSSFMTAPGAPVDPTLQKEMDFMKTWLDHSEAADVPFATYLSKSQEENQ